MDEVVADATVASLHGEQPRFDWVGISWLDGDDLVLGHSAAGPPSTHGDVAAEQGEEGSRRG